MKSEHRHQLKTSELEKMTGKLQPFFEKHGLKNVGYWRNSIGGRSDELWYMLAFEDMAQRDAAWAAFATDPEWQKVRAESEADGPLVHHIENRILAPTDFSPLD